MKSGSFASVIIGLVLLGTLIASNLHLKKYPQHSGFSAYDFRTPEQQAAQQLEENKRIFLFSYLLPLAALSLGSLLILKLCGKQITAKKALIFIALTVIVPLLLPIGFRLNSDFIAPFIGLAPVMFVGGYLLYYFGLRILTETKLGAKQIAIGVLLSFVTGLIAELTGIHFFRNASGLLLLGNLAGWIVFVIGLVSWWALREAPTANA